MGQKVNPHGLRVGIIKDWDSRWFASKKEFGDTLVEDYELRRDIKKKFYTAGISKIEIERDGKRVRIFIHAAKPGMVIGKRPEVKEGEKPAKGAEPDKLRELRLDCEKRLNKPVVIKVIEIKQPDLNAQLVAENIALQLEKRVSFRRAMKQAIGRAMRFGAKGIKTMASGRLGGAEIARSETYHEGTIPLQTLRADIDYGFAEANTTYGKIGIKVWLYRGEVLHESNNNNRRNNRRRPRREGGKQNANAKKN